MYYIHYGNSPKDEAKFGVKSYKKALKLLKQYKENYTFAYMTNNLNEIMEDCYE